MFSMSLGDVMPGGDDDSKREDGPSLDSTFEDLAPTEFLSPFVDDVDFVFPDGEMLEDISRPKRSRKDSASMDETGPEITQWKGSVDGSMFRKGHSFEGTGLSNTPRGSGASASAAASGAADGGDDASGDKNVSTEHLEDLLAVLAARVAPVDESTAEIFDSDAEDDDDGERSDDVSHSQSDVESEASDVKPQISQSGMPGPPNIMPMPVMDMSGSHAAFAFPKAEFDQLQMLHGAPPGFKMEMDDRKTKRGRKRRKITPEEKAELTRQRNREHARSTRRRKKMYVECLKKQVAELLAKQQQIDSGIFEPLSGSQAEEITIRKAIIQSFLQYRTTNVLERSRWRDLLDESFTLTQPRTPFRATNIGEAFGNSRRVKGIDAVVQDTASITAMLEMIRSRVRQQKPEYSKSVTLSYNVDSSDILVVGDKLMCHWTTSTTGLIAAGFASECAVDGMLRCTFNSKHKLTDMELTYDVMAFTRQMQQHSLIDLSVVTSWSRPGMVRSGSAPKIPLRSNMPLPPLAAAFGGMKPNGMKKPKSSSGMQGMVGPIGPMMPGGMGMPGMIPMMLPGVGGMPAPGMKVQLPMSGMAGMMPNGGMAGMMPNGMMGGMPTGGMAGMMPNGMMSMSMPNGMTLGDTSSTISAASSTLSTGSSSSSSSSSTVASTASSLGGSSSRSGSSENLLKVEASGGGGGGDMSGGMLGASSQEGAGSSTSSSSSSSSSVANSTTPTAGGNSISPGGMEDGSGGGDKKATPPKSNIMPQMMPSILPSPQMMQWGMMGGMAPGMMPSGPMMMPMGQPIFPMGMPMAQPSNGMPMQPGHMYTGNGQMGTRQPSSSAGPRA